MSDAIRLQSRPLRRHLTSMKRRGGERTRAKFACKMVRIWSGEHRAWWRPNRSGYTTCRGAAGIYPFEEAWRASQHCCPMKAIAYEVAEDGVHCVTSRNALRRATT